MDFHLTKEQLLVRKMYREFAENEVKPLATEIDEEERFPMETVEKMAKLGMMGIYFPKQYGGAGADVLSYAMCVEELAKVCGTTAVIVSAHTSLCAAPIFENGTEEQKMKYLPDLCSGKKIGAFGLTEPGAGTDAQGQQTTAVLDESGENYILNGSKCFITNGNVADTFVVIAVTGKTVDKRGRSMKEISAFIVEKDDKGFSQGKHEKKMGIRGSSTCDLIFEDCVIPKDRMLGKKGEGFKIAMKTLDGGRIGIASQALGLGEGAVEEAIKYTKERVQFGKRISQFQNTQFQLAEMHTRMQAAQFLVYSAAMKKQNHEPYSMDAAMAKLFAAEAASDVTRLARREYQPRLARLFADNLTVFRHFLQGLGVNRQTFLVHQPRLAEQGDIDVHTQHIAVARQTVDAAVLVGQHFEVRRAELIQHARALQRIGHVADKMLADQQLRVGKRRLEDARRRAALRHWNVAAQGVGVVIRHQRHVRVLLLHRFAVALKERLFRLRRRIRGPVAQRNRAGQVRINDLFRHRQRQRAQRQAQHQQHGNQFFRPSHGKTSFTSSWRIFR